MKTPVAVCILASCLFGSQAFAQRSNQASREVPNVAYAQIRGEAANTLYLLMNAAPVSWWASERDVQLEAKIEESEDSRQRLICVKKSKSNGAVIAPTITYTCDTARSKLGQELPPVVRPL